MNQNADRASLLAALAEIYGEGSAMMTAYEGASDEALARALDSARAAREAGGRGRRMADTWTTDRFEEIGGR